MNLKCELSGEYIKCEDGALVHDHIKKEWKFVKVSRISSTDYSKVLSELNNPYSFIDWMAQLNDKTWFEPDKLMSTFERLRSCGKLRT